MNETAPDQHVAKSSFLAFLDECGDHSLVKIDPDFPLFVLALVVVERAAYRDTILPSLNGLKLRYWDHEGINFHSREIRLREGPFRMFLNKPIREAFMAEIAGLMQSMPYILFLTAIRKQQYMAQHGANATNPYDLALELTLEAVVQFLEEKQVQVLPIVAEARGKREDDSLEKVFYRLMTRGTASVQADRFKRLDCSVSFQPKISNIVGTQIADLCAYPSARHVLNPQKPNPAFEIVRKHLYAEGERTGWKVYP